MLQVLFLILIAAPIAEIFVLIKVGSVIGALATIAVVIGTAFLGAVLLRIQGVGTLRRLQAEMAAGELPAVTLVEGACLLFAGALLLTPGFITDAVGFACLVPALRRSLATFIVLRLQTTVFSSMRGQSVYPRPGDDTDSTIGPTIQAGRTGGHKRAGHTIEGEVEPLDPR